MGDDAKAEREAKQPLLLETETEPPVTPYAAAGFISHATIDLFQEY